MKTIKFERKCPVCHSVSGVQINCLGYALYDAYPISRSVNLVECANCGFIFYDSRSTKEDYDRYYKLHEYYATTQSAGMGGCTPADSKRFNQYIDTVKKYCDDSSDGKIVDIGCAQGGLLHTLSDRGFKNLAGIDPLKSNVNLISAFIENGSIGDATSIPLIDNSCSILFQTHVLEHVWDLSKAMNEIYRVLEKTGIAYLEVPDISFYPTLKEAPLFDFFYEHINHFDSHSFRNLLQSHSFEIIDWGHKSFDGSDESPEYCLYAVVKKGKKQSIQKQPQTPVESIRTLFEIPDSINNFLKKYRDLEQPIHVWGLSSYMLYILETYLFPNVNIVGLYDSDTSKQTQTINGLPITSPNSLYNLPEGNTVVVPSGPYAHKLIEILHSEKFVGDFFIL